MGDAEASPGPSSSASSSPPDPTRAAKLCRRLHRGLAVRVGTSLPASAQHKAALQLLELRDLVANGTALDVACKTQLLCVGIACARAAWYSGGDEAAQQMRLTMTLVFALLVLACGAGAFQAAPLRSTAPARPAAAASVSMKRICDITGKSANNANTVTFSNKKNARLQQVNLQTKRFFSPELNRNVRLKVATSTMRTITKLGLDETAKKYGVDLSKY